MFTQDYILNGEGHGAAAEMLEGVKFDTGLLRPFIDDDNRPSCVVNTGRVEWNPKTKQREPVREIVRIKDLRDAGIDSPVFNATALRKEEWLRMDQRIHRAARYRLTAWADLAAANTYSGFDGMGTMILEHETMSDPGEAQIDMEGNTDIHTDQPKFQLEGLPLPILKSGFRVSKRKLNVSRNRGTPVSTVMGEACGRRVAELLEKLTIGTNTGITYGGGSSTPTYGRSSTIFGYTNFTNRITYASLATPTGSNPDATIANVLHMLDLAYAKKFYGPFMLYHSNDWTQYMENDYILTGGNVATQTLRERLLAIKGIQDVKRLDFAFGSAPTFQNEADRYDSLNPFTLLLVQMTSDVCQAVNGMDITTVQWETMGGMDLHFMVMTIAAPQMFADFYGNCGIVHGTTI